MRYKRRKFVSLVLLFFRLIKAQQSVIVQYDGATLPQENFLEKKSKEFKLPPSSSKSKFGRAKTIGATPDSATRSSHSGFRIGHGYIGSSELAERTFWGKGRRSSKRRGKGKGKGKGDIQIEWPHPDECWEYYFLDDDTFFFDGGKGYNKIQYGHDPEYRGLFGLMTGRRGAHGKGKGRKGGKKSGKGRKRPTAKRRCKPTQQPIQPPSQMPVPVDTVAPTSVPTTSEPSQTPSSVPSQPQPSTMPSSMPTLLNPSGRPSEMPSISSSPTTISSERPSTSFSPSSLPSSSPLSVAFPSISTAPSLSASQNPSFSSSPSTIVFSEDPSLSPTGLPQCIISANTFLCPELVLSLDPPQDCECYNFCGGVFIGCCNFGELCKIDCDDALAAGCQAVPPVPTTSPQPTGSPTPPQPSPPSLPPAPSEVPSSNPTTTCTVGANANLCPGVIATQEPIEGCDCYNYCNGRFNGCCGLFDVEECEFNCVGFVIAGCQLGDAQSSAPSSSALLNVVVTNPENSAALNDSTSPSASFLGENTRIPSSSFDTRIETTSKNFPLYSLQLTISNSLEMDLQNDINEMVQVTARYLESYFLSTFSTDSLEAFETSALFHKTNVKTNKVMITFRSVAVLPSRAAETYTEVELMDKLVGAFVGDPVNGYLGMLQSLPQDNIFSSTTMIRFISDEFEKHANGGLGTLTILASIAGALFISIVSVLLYRYRRTRSFSQEESSKGETVSLSNIAQRKDSSISILGPANIRSHDYKSNEQSDIRNWWEVRSKTSDDDDNSEKDPSTNLKSSLLQHKQHIQGQETGDTPSSCNGRSMASTLTDTSSIPSSDDTEFHLNNFDRNLQGMGKEKIFPQTTSPSSYGTRVTLAAQSDDSAGEIAIGSELMRPSNHRKSGNHQSVTYHPVPSDVSSAHSDCAINADYSIQRPSCTPIRDGSVERTNMFQEIDDVNMAIYDANMLTMKKQLDPPTLTSGSTAPSWNQKMAERTNESEFHALRGPVQAVAGLEPQACDIPESGNAHSSRKLKLRVRPRAADPPQISIGEVLSEGVARRKGRREPRGKRQSSPQRFHRGK